MGMASLFGLRGKGTLIEITGAAIQKMLKVPMPEITRFDPTYSPMGTTEGEAWYPHCLGQMLGGPIISDQKIQSFNKSRGLQKICFGHYTHHRF